MSILSVLHDRALVSGRQESDTGLSSSPLCVWLSVRLFDLEALDATPSDRWVLSYALCSLRLSGLPALRLSESLPRLGD